MSKVISGVRPPQWWKHLRPYYKRKFWKQHRHKEKSDVKQE